MNEISATPDDAVPGSAQQSLQHEPSDYAELALIRLITQAYTHNIQSWLAMMRFRILDIEQTELAPSVVQALDALRKDADSLIDTVRGMNLEVELAIEPVEVDEVVERISREFAGTAFNFGFEWHCDAPGVMVDAPGLPYIIRELLWNFEKFSRPWAHDETGDETQRVSLRTSTVGRRPGWVNINVSYTGAGIGMTPEFTEQMFQRGFSTDARSRGLGLWLGRSLARHAGGDLKANASETEGLQFTIELPIIGKSS